MARTERRWKAGTRVRIVAPGYPFHGQIGTVRRDVDDPAGLLVVMRDDGKQSELATNEAARLRDQRGSGAIDV
jgi:hypothetical protein